MIYEIVEGLAPTDIVFVHGNLASNKWWEPTLAELRKHSRADFKGRAILAEWRGCGRTPAPSHPQQLHPRALANDYVALIDRLEIKNAAIVGHSYGGLIALITMSLRPQILKRALVVNPVGAGGRPYDQATYDRFQEMRKDRNYCAQILSATIENCQTESPYFQALVDDAFGVAKINWQTIPKALSEIDEKPSLSQLKNPVLVLHGMNDRVLPIQNSEDLVGVLPNAKLMSLKKYGHSPLIENPELFVSTLNSFLFAKEGVTL